MWFRRLKDLYWSGIPWEQDQIHFDQYFCWRVRYWMVSLENTNVMTAESKASKAPSTRFCAIGPATAPMRYKLVLSVWKSNWDNGGRMKTSSYNSRYALLRKGEVRSIYNKSTIRLSKKSWTLTIVKLHGGIHGEINYQVCKWFEDGAKNVKLLAASNSTSERV